MVDVGLSRKIDRLNEIGNSLLAGRFYYFIDKDRICKTYEEIIGANLQLRTKIKYQGNIVVQNAYLSSLIRETNIDRNYSVENISYLIGALNNVMKIQSYRLEMDDSCIATIFKKSGTRVTMLCKGSISSCLNCLIIDKNEWRIQRLGDGNGNSTGNTAKARGCK